MHLTPSEARALPIVTGAAPADPAAWRRSAVNSRLWPAAVLTAGGLRRLATRCSARGPLWVIKRLADRVSRAAGLPDDAAAAACRSVAGFAGRRDARLGTANFMQATEAIGLESQDRRR